SVVGSAVDTVSFDPPLPIRVLGDMLRAGDIISERFEIREEAGRGGMGVVYRAVDHESGETVALKLLHAATNDAELRSRFVREAEVLSQVTHPNIVRYIAHGAHQAHPQTMLYLVMEWLEGEELEERLLWGRGLATAEVVRLASRVASALAAAHRHGIIHRDIKPSNIFLVQGELDSVRLLDFGIARANAASRMTRTGLALGTPGYMAPEQATGERDIDARADLFALGAVLFECLTGRPAYEGNHAMAILTKVLFETPPRVDEYRDGLPQVLVDMVGTLMERERDARPADASWVAQAFEALGPLEPDVVAPRSEPLPAITDR